MLKVSEIINNLKVKTKHFTDPQEVWQSSTFNRAIHSKENISYVETKVGQYL